MKSTTGGSKMNKRIFVPIIVVMFLFSSLGAALSAEHGTEEKFGGIGVKVAQLFDPGAENNMGNLVVLDVLDGTPASKNGIQKGDIITHVDGEPTKSKTFKYLMLEKMRGKIGSEINMSIERAHVKTPLNFSLARVEITYSPEQKG
ncbi:MAG: PDZ domain-containing protein [Candidatus Electrothrix sp. AR5]|nr:PDZ domain-containing protein [Candidatus Electrothrix sp. AR5]